MEDDPRTQYSRLREERRAQADREQRRHVGLGNARVAVFAAGAILAWLGFWRGAISPWWLAGPVVAFVALVKVHERVLRAKGLADRAARFYQDGLDRLDGRWHGKGESGDRFRDDSQPYSEDLDIFGQASLFELLCRARTRIGEATLAKWLLSPASGLEIRARQEAVTELRPRLALREDLAVLGEDARAGVHPEELAAWGEAPPLLESRGARLAAACLGLAGLISIPVSIALGLFTPFVLMALINGLFTLRYRRSLQRVIAAVELPAHDLDLLASVLRRVEHESFNAAKLAALRRALEVEGRPPSHRIAVLDQLVAILDSHDHLVVRLINPVVLWTLQAAFAVETWRKKSGPAVRRWLDAVGEFEALSSLASYSYEHPADPFPEISADSPCFEGEAIGHPLIPDAELVRNDIRLGGELRVLIVSGSNMSGKSTLLRTVGTAAVLAMAGGPVRAARLRLSPMAVGASIRVTDSLKNHVSRFYAQITRLRRLVEISRGPLPLLFLLDELLHGTNSHDRRIGAEAVVRSLVEAGAIGLVTTHDLALAHIADGLAGRAANVHFEDQFEAGQIRFDYQLRPGVVRKSNALELMRSVGLDV